MGMKKANTTSYHPQTDGLVEWFNCTLIDMLAKTVKKSGEGWDERLLYVLYAYRTSPQESTKELPFYLLYGRDPRPPTEEALSPSQSRQEVEVDTYKAEIIERMSAAWMLAHEYVHKAQKNQKTQHD